MKTFSHSLLSSLLILAGSVALASASPVPSLEVTVSNSAGKTVAKVHDDARGNFTTPPLEPGNYTVLLKSTKSYSGQYAVMINPGKDKFAATVNGQKFSRGGIAARVNVDKPVNLTGSVMDAKSAAAAEAMKKASKPKAPTPTPTVTKPSSMVF
ncbi:MAG TPA: carboxypeptidase-like regulatory domain-containing protein [Chthoniobacterales bacterium]|jgi:hypothetical protein